MEEESTLLHNLEHIKNRILNQQRMSYSDKNMSLCRYVTFETFRSMTQPEAIGNGTVRTNEDSRSGRGLDLWVMDGDTMNDPWEGAFLIDRSKHWGIADIDNPRALLSKLFEENIGQEVSTAFDFSPAFIASFSTAADDLDLWRHYCQGHGVCLRFSAPSHVPLYELEYGQEAADRALDKVSWALRPIIQRESLRLNRKARAMLQPICYLFKSVAHSTDKEFRLIETDQNWSDIKMMDSIGDQKNDGKNICRLYVLRKKFFYSEENAYNGVIVGPLAATLDAERGDKAYLKEVKLRLCWCGLENIPINRSKHVLRY